MRIVFLIVLYLCALPAIPARAATERERKEFETAVKQFRDGVLNYELADGALSRFLAAYSQSEFRSQAVLYLAQAKFKRGDYATAETLLKTDLNYSGRLADQYIYWLAETYFASTNFVSAAETYHLVYDKYAGSSNALAASYGEALSRYRLGEAAKAAELLKRPDGAFQKEAKSRPNDAWAIRGSLLLAEASLDLKDNKAARGALDPVSFQASGELEWRRQYLSCRLLRGEGKLDQAHATVTNLLALPITSQDAGLRAAAAEIEGGILEGLKRTAEAVVAYRKNLSAPSAGARRFALSKIVDLNVAQNRLTNAITELERFAIENPADPALDAASLTVGELCLREFYRNGDPESMSTPPTLPGQMSLMSHALTNFTSVITREPQSPHSGQARLNRGWCWWHLGKPAECAIDFKEAARLLPPGKEQAVALFKLGEAELQLQHYAEGASNLWLVATQFPSVPAVREELLDLVLFKLLRAGIGSADMEGANRAIKELLAIYPDGQFSQKGLLLYGQALSRAGKPADARRELEEFLKRFPESKLFPQVQLALSRSFMRGDDWRDAALTLDKWVSENSGDPDLPQVEYERAWAHWKAGNETNALSKFTNFVARFPRHAMAPLAQNWVADFYFNRGQLYEAEANYQILFQNTNWPIEMAYQARLAAGRAAFARRNWADSSGYLTNLINDAQCPADVKAVALFAYGDTMIEAAEADPARPLDKFAEANKAFLRITQTYPTNPIAAQAWGKVGNGHLQLAREDPKRLDQAAQAYTNALMHPLADFGTRALAEVGLGNVAERQGKIKEALEHYAAVIYYEDKLQAGERPDPRIVKEAGVSAARLLESQQRWDDAVRIYERLSDALPNLKAELRRNIERARERQRQPNGKGKA